jgi:hypothetical protein
MALLTLIAAAFIAAAQPTVQLGGEWTVDLSTDPAKPYTKPMKLDLEGSGTVTGTFYDSKIQADRWKTDRGRTCASFREDANRPSNHGGTTRCLGGATTGIEGVPV